MLFIYLLFFFAAQHHEKKRRKKNYHKRSDHKMDLNTISWPIHNIMHPPDKQIYTKYVKNVENRKKSKPKEA